MFIVFADASQKIEDPIGRYFTESNLYRLWSLMTLPVTLPIDLTYAVTKRYENILSMSILTCFQLLLSLILEYKDK